MRDESRNLPETSLGRRAETQRACPVVWPGLSDTGRFGSGKCPGPLFRFGSVVGVEAWIWMDGEGRSRESSEHWRVNDILMPFYRTANENSEFNMLRHILSVNIKG